MIRHLRSRALGCGFLIIVLAACVGGLSAWRVSRVRLQGTGSVWQPPTATASSRLVATPTALMSDTPVIESTVTSPSVPTALRPTVLPAALSPTLVPTASPTAPKPESTATPTPYPASRWRYVPASGVRHAMEGCPGPYILGYVRDAAGNRLASVRLRSTDQWGNVAYAVTKSGITDLGRYDFPLFLPPGAPATYRLVVLDEAGRPASPEVNVAHHQEGPDEAADCHWLDWRRVE